MSISINTVTEFSLYLPKFWYTINKVDYLRFQSWYQELYPSRETHDYRSQFAHFRLNPLEFFSILDKLTNNHIISKLITLQSD